MRYFYPSMPSRIDINSEIFKKIEDDPLWVGEVKRNEWRCLATKTTVLKLWTRRKTLISDKLPRLRETLDKMLPENTIIDGGLCHKRTKGIKELYYAFDIICYRNVLLFSYTWEQRRQILEHVVKPVDGLIILSDPTPTGKRQLYYDNIGSDDFEGIVLKQRHSQYSFGYHDCVINPYWLKVKRPENHQYEKRG